MRLLILIALLIASNTYAQSDRSLGTAYEPIRNTALTITTAPLTSSFTYVSDSRLYRVVSDVDALVDIGTSPSATVSSTFLPAFAVEVWPISDNSKISVRAKSTTGIFYIGEMKH